MPWPSKIWERMFVYQKDYDCKNERNHRKISEIFGIEWVTYIYIYIETTCVPWADFIKENAFARRSDKPRQILGPFSCRPQFFSATEMQDRMRILPNLLKRTTKRFSKRTTKRHLKKTWEKQWTVHRLPWNHKNLFLCQEEFNQTSAKNCIPRCASKAGWVQPIVSFTAQIGHSKSTIPKVQMKKTNIASSNYFKLSQLETQSNFNQCHDIYRETMWNLHRGTLKIKPCTILTLQHWKPNSPNASWVSPPSVHPVNSDKHDSAIYATFSSNFWKDKFGKPMKQC